MSGVEFGVAKALNLIHNCSNIAVTCENRLQYIHLVSHYRLTKQIKMQSEVFFEGLSEMNQMISKMASVNACVCLLFLERTP